MATRQLFLLPICICQDWDGKKERRCGSNSPDLCKKKFLVFFLEGPCSAPEQKIGPRQHGAHNDALLRVSHAQLLEFNHATESLRLLLLLPEVVLHGGGGGGGAGDLEFAESDAHRKRHLQC